MAMETGGSAAGPMARLANVYHQMPFQGKICTIVALAFIWYRLGGRIVIRNGKVILYIPLLAYQLSQHAFFGVNLMFDTLCYLQPSQSRWNDVDTSLSVDNLKANHQIDLDRIKQLILSQKDVAFNETDLVCLFDSLPSVSMHEMLLGRVWDGRVLRTNKSALELVDWLVMRPLALFGFRWGKRFRDQYNGDPLLFNWAKKVYVPLPICESVTVADIKWRGVSTGTMVYNNQSWKDFLRVLENDPENQRIVLIGAWTNRWQTAGWFTLTWDPSVPVE